MNAPIGKNTAWKEIVALSFTPDAFDRYCRTLKWQTWKPSLIVLHNTATPTLTQRPQGFTLSHIQNLVTYYRDTRRWSAGPHLFIDDRQIWVFTPLTVPGVHSPSWNATALGIEMLGNFETEDFMKGRGAQVRKNTISAIATLISVLKMHPPTLKLHREDPLTTHACPGKNVKKIELILEVQNELVNRAKEKSTSQTL